MIRENTTIVGGHIDVSLHLQQRNVLLHGKKKQKTKTIVSLQFPPLFSLFNDEMVLHFGLFAAYVILTKLLDGFV